MSCFHIKGGKKLNGSITIQGSKNEGLQIICATLLTEEPVRIKNIPDITDINNLISLLEHLGVSITKNGKGDLTFQAKNINLGYLDTPEFKKLSQTIRGSIMISGPILSRFGRSNLPKPGGDKIGRRRIDVHLQGFKSLGAIYKPDPSNKSFFITTQSKLKGSNLLLEEASVTGTANLIMSATLAKGITTIYNAACEPYIQQLCKMLNKMGAKITGIGSNLLTIEGVIHLNGCNHTLLPDMIEIGSWIGLAAMTQSNITIKNIDFEQLGIIPKYFEKLGITLLKEENNLKIPEQDIYEIQTNLDGSIPIISDAPWPGLTPDLISIFLVIAMQAKGSVLIHQKMFESRLFFVDTLIDMGGKIILCDPHRATVIGLEREYSLKGTNITSPDIRAGIALLIAALSAKGKSTIHNIQQIDRGYENIDLKLQNLGADIKRT